MRKSLFLEPAIEKWRAIVKAVISEQDKGRVNSAVSKIVQRPAAPAPTRKAGNVGND